MNESEITFSSNGVRLSLREWFIVGVVISAVFYFGPKLWQRIEKFEPEHDYRVPYELGNDYWLYHRYCRWAGLRYEALVIGDSVIWGHYVSRHNTLSHYLNEIAGRAQFANLGVDGIHPVALEGLLRYYGRGISGKKVILHLNPLWMSHPKHDLQTKKEHPFNHPRLVPQFVPSIRCYKASYSTRISAVCRRYVPFLNWTCHLNIAYFQSSDSRDISGWTLKHPYKNPLSAVGRQLPTSDYYEKKTRTRQPGPAKQAPPWVPLQTSFQWRFFRRSIELLKHRDNRVFVLVGPFNEHILKANSYDTYQKIKRDIEAWLQQNNIPYYIPAVLPRELYVDASHPTSEGYALLAKQLFESDSFGKFHR